MKRAQNAHVMLQDVLPKPSGAREADRIEAQVRPDPIIWLVDPVVAKRTQQRREGAKG